MYDVDIKTFMSWLFLNPKLKKLTGNNKKLFAPSEVKLIFSELGTPETD